MEEKFLMSLNCPKIIIVIIFGFKKQTTSVTFSYCAGWYLENKTLNIYGKCDENTREYHIYFLLLTT